ncbi:HET-domain-containing protein [Colletotrichum somersetense]|nr:HET-domain-containing protein [Colletotrichum somersetense]
MCNEHGRPAAQNPPSAVYAILSHTWEAEEVSFRDMEDLEKAAKKKGFTKIVKACEIAHASGIKWAWVDTCCIDKSSSAELTESINSMWRWYKDAEICYTFFSDLPTPQSNVDPFLQRRATFEHLKSCRWFTRGWTLQELLAPTNIDFFDSSWKQRGTKASLQYELSILTGIHYEVLGDSRLIYQMPVACRMSWAACRQTTRDEDRAYSLFGIFDVNLPLIYGEGAKAFTRLQEAILQNSTDLSIFAWDGSDDGQLYTGLLARSPSDYADCCGTPIRR